MAITKIWKIVKSLRSALEYTTNEQKTDLGTVLAYTTNRRKTELVQSADSLDTALSFGFTPNEQSQQIFVSGLHCTPETAKADMERTKRRFGKTDSTLAFHAVQSFKEGEVSPEVCHQLGKELAQRVWGERFEVVVSTHLDRGHLHNHFIINSVSFADGKRYYDNKKSYYGTLRRANDAICRAHGLAVLENEPTARGEKHHQWQNTQTVREQLRQDLDRYIASCGSFAELKQAMRGNGYVIDDNPKHKYVTILPPYGNKPIRLKGSVLGYNYTPQQIETRILLRRFLGRTETPIIPPPPVQYRLKVRGLAKTQRARGFLAIYLHYFYLFRKKKKRIYCKPASAKEIAQAKAKIAKMQERAEFLNRAKIQTLEDLQAYKANVDATLETLITERKALYNHRRGEASTYQAKLQQLSEQIMTLRKERKLCAAIENEHNTIQQTMKRWSKEPSTPQKETKPKEQPNHEYFP